MVPPKDAVALKVITYKGNKPVGRIMTLLIADLRQRAGKKND